MAASEKTKVFPDLPSLSFSRRSDRPGPATGMWSGHQSFAYDLVASTQPSLIVELGTYYGESYFTFCQAVDEKRLPCVCYAVDTWKGDPHGGFYGAEVYESVLSYNARNYSLFSYLLAATFDEALNQFSDGSIDLLHIDGYHSYEIAKHDFESWIPKVRDGGAVLIHDTAIRDGDFGVWRLWEELRNRFPTFFFSHGCGLGVLLKSASNQPKCEFLSALFDADQADQDRIRRYYGSTEKCGAELRGSDLGPRNREIAVQVFWCLEENYCEKDSVLQQVPVGEWRHLTFNLPPGSSRKPLRLDPANCPALVWLDKVQLRTAGDRRIQWRLSPAGDELELAGDITRFEVDGEALLFSYGCDPILMLGGSNRDLFTEPMVLDFWIKLEEDFSAVERYVREQSEAAKVLQAELASVRITMNRLAQENTGLHRKTERVDQLESELSLIKTRMDQETYVLVTRERELDAVKAELQFAKLTNRDLTRALAKEFSRLQTNVDRHGETKDELAQARDELTQARDELARARAHGKQESERRRAIENSLSWRFTLPLRGIAGFLTRGLARGRKG